MKSNPPLMIYKNTILSCPNCSCYLISPFNNKIRSGGIPYRTFICDLCHYRFAETKIFLKANGHVAKLRTKLRRRILSMQQLQIEINNLQFLVQCAEEKPKEFKQVVKSDLIIVR